MSRNRALGSRASYVLALTGALAGWPTNTAQAAGVASLIEWEAPDGCPGALEVHARLTSVLGGEPESLGKLARVRGSVVRSGAGYRLVLEALERDRRSSRLFEASSCEDLVETAAIAIALAIAPESAPPLPNGEVLETHIVPAPAAAAADEPVESDPPDNAEGASVRGLASAGAVVEYGALPGPTPGVAVGGGVRLGALSLGLHGAWLATDTLRVAPGRDVEFDLIYAGMRGCYALPTWGPELGACACFEAGRLRALGLELDQGRAVEDLWLAAGAALEARWALGRALGLELRAEPMLPLNRKEYTINGSDDVHTPSRVSARLYLGLTFSPE
ncbi:MAG TPA: hypothetical protein VNN80_15245 [Polyangiaceae bacterium]|nr:hypothetical protein [Polyangiaceae bacterium]